MGEVGSHEPQSGHQAADRDMNDDGDDGDGDVGDDGDNPIAGYLFEY